MSPEAASKPGTPPTAQGQRTRERIVCAAAQLIAERGAAGTSLDDVRAATQVSKSQLYHYFGDKQGLVQAVVDHQAASVLARQVEALDAVESWKDLERWADTMVAVTEEHDTRGGCPIGTLAAGLADTDEASRAQLSAAFERWRAAISGALTTLRDDGLLDPSADIDELTTTTLAAIQGGLLLAKTTRDVRYLRTALDGALAQLRSHASRRGAARAG